MKDYFSNHLWVLSLFMIRCIIYDALLLKSNVDAIYKLPLLFGANGSGNSINYANEKHHIYVNKKNHYIWIRKYYVMNKKDSIN